MSLNDGYVYVLHNICFDKYGECYKIGRTINIDNRLTDYTTYYPDECKLKYITKPLTYYKEVEKAVHKLLNESRISSNREFFKCSLNDIVRLIEEVCKYTKEELINILEGKEIKNILIKPTYSCNICGSSYTQKQHLTRHITTSKNCFNIASETFKFKCIWCNKLFITNNQLGNHYKICSVDKENSYNLLFEKYNMSNNIHKKQIEEKDKKIKELQEQIFKLEKGSLGIKNKKYNTVTLMCSKPLSLEKEMIKGIVENSISTNTIGDKIASWFVDNICRNEEGKITLQCTDRKRKTFKYIDEDDNLQTIKGDEIEMLLTGLGLQVNNQFIKNLMELTYKDNIVK
jgi:hypothetical protein